MSMYRITTEFSGPLVAGGGVNRLYFLDTGGSAADAHGAVVAWWAAAAVGMMSTLSYTVSGEIELVNIGTGAVEGIETTDAVTSTGVGSGDPLPPATQALVRLRSGFYVGGREVRGRIFIPGQGEINQTTGVPDTTLRNAYNTAIGNLIGDPDSSLVVWSRTKGTAASVVSGSTWEKWAVLRSRRD